MSKFIRNLSLFIAGLPAVFDPARATITATGDAIGPSSDLAPVSLRPLNHEFDNLFAGHRSHSSHASHASHASHYSGSSGGYTAPSTPAPQPEYQAPAAPAANLVPIVPSVTSQATPNAEVKEPVRSNSDKLILQVMRVQIALTSLKFYDGRIHGVFDAETRKALRNFQTFKGISSTGLMTTPTLNALGVPASS